MQPSTLEVCTLNRGLYLKLLHKQLPAFPIKLYCLRGVFLGRTRIPCLLFWLCLKMLLAGEPQVKNMYIHKAPHRSLHAPGGPWGPVLFFPIKRQKSWVLRKLIYSLLHLWLYTKSANNFTTGSTSGVTYYHMDLCHNTKYASCILVCRQPYSGLHKKKHNQQR